MDNAGDADPAATRAPGQRPDRAGAGPRMIGIGLIGYGYWGPKVLRALAATADCRVLAVSDCRAERLRAAHADHPAIAVSAEAAELYRDPRIDAVVIATPAPTHASLAEAALAAGKHVWVEKPLAATLDEARRLADAVERSKRILMVDHTFLYSGAVHTLGEIMGRHAAAPLTYEAVRSNGGVRRDDVNVIWDLAVHDLSIIDCVMPAAPCAIAATARPDRPGALEASAQLRMWFAAESLEARVEVDWFGPARTRRTQVRSSDRTIVYDDCEAEEKIRVFAHDAPAAPAGGVAVQVDLTEPLRNAAAHFVRSIAAGRQPRSDVHAGLRMVSWLDAATRSLREGGRPVTLPRPGATG